MDSHKFIESISNSLELIRKQLMEEDDHAKACYYLGALKATIELNMQLNSCEEDEDHGC